jgi:hypothetical protein
MRRGLGQAFRPRTLDCCLPSFPQRTRKERAPVMMWNLELWSMEIHQHHLGMLLHSFEDNFWAVFGNVEVANIKVRR